MLTLYMSERCPRVHEQSLRSSSVGLPSFKDFSEDGDEKHAKREEKDEQYGDVKRYPFEIALQLAFFCLCPSISCIPLLHQELHEPVDMLGFSQYQCSVLHQV
jgi:hypothetical protein